MKYLITKCTLFLLALLVSSCAQDELTQVRPSTNEAVLSFTLPNRSNVDVGAETKTAKNDFEKTISNMNIYIVEATAGESAPADDAEVLEHYNTYSNTGSEISVSILSREDPCWVVALVNISDNTFDPATYEDIKNLSLGLSSLYVTPGGEYASELPMFGQEYFANINTGNHRLDLVHICVRIDVVSVADNFALESVTLMNGATTGHFVPQSPMAEYTGTDVVQYQTVEMSSEETTLRPIYLFENNGGTPDAKNYTDIVLGGKYTLSTDNEELSFIKVKLEHSDPLNADIIRNTLYKLTLLTVNKNNIGYSSIEDAQKGEYSDVKIKIDVDLDAFSDVVVGNGDYYMSLSNSEYRVFIPSGAKADLTAVALRFNKNSTSTVDMTKIKKEISLGANSQGITIVGGAGDKTTTWTANQDIDIKVDLADDAKGSLIVRIGNLVKEVLIVREQTDTNFPTVFNDDDYVYAHFTNAAPAWLKIATKNETPRVTNELYSEDGFKLGFSTDRDGSQSAELYLSRSSEKGRTKVYVEQYKVTGTSEFNVSGLDDETNISYAGATLTTAFTVSGSTAALDFLDQSHQPASSDWEAEFSDDGGATWTTTKPAWINMPTSGTGPLTESTIEAIAREDLILTKETLDEQNKLKMATPKGSSSNPYNLANNSDANNENESTANCYLVGAPGTYKLPLIYGNAKENGGPNTAAYTGSNFFKHDGGVITKPEIEGAANAILMWQDAPGLITEVQLLGSDYLVFTVPQETIMEGNAVLAVRNEANQIMWSWHIWVTNYTLEDYKEVQYKVGAISGTSKMLDVNLGWCSPGKLQYGTNPREVKVRLRQHGGAVKPSERGVTYRQNVGNIISVGNSPFYQYGRKDPMLSSDGSGDFNKAQYGNLKWKAETRRETLANVIKNPNVMYLSDIDWSIITYNNLWSARNNSADITHIIDHIKTVYDPSPVGYVIPPGTYFTGFTTTGSATIIQEQFNIKGFFELGYKFYCGLSKTGNSTIYFPTAGLRHKSNGNTSFNITHGYIHTASPSINSSSYILYYRDSFINTCSPLPRGHGISVRPVQQ